MCLYIVFCIKVKTGLRFLIDIQWLDQNIIPLIFFNRQQKNYKPMKSSKEIKYQSAHFTTTHKLPEILFNKTGYIQKLEAQENKKNKREEMERTIRDRLNESYHSYIDKQKEYYHSKVKQNDEKLLGKKKDKIKKNTSIIKQHNEIMKNALNNKQNILRQEQKARRQMYAIETQKLQKSILLRSNFLENKSTLSRSSRSIKSNQSCNSRINLDESLNKINIKLEKAKQNRQLKIKNDVMKSKSKIQQRRESALLRSTRNQQKIFNSSLHSFVKNLSSLKARMADVKNTQSQKIQSNMKRQRQNKVKADYRSNLLKQDDQNKIMKQHQNLEKKMEDAQSTRVQNCQKKTRSLIQKTKQKLDLAEKRCQSKKSIQFMSRQIILKKINQDFRVFKVFKTELQKTTSSNFNKNIDF